MSVATAVTVKTAIPEVNLEVYAGDDFEFTLHWQSKEGTNPLTDMDLSGTHAAHIRSKETDAVTSAVIEIDDHASDVGSLTFLLDAENSRSLCMSPEARLTRDLDGTLKMRFVGKWDCQWTNPDGRIRTIAKGLVNCWLDVTRTEQP